MLATLSLTAVDELIAARKGLHGGAQGAPRVLRDGSREGRAINQACVLMLSATLQSYVEDVFIECSEKAFSRQLQSSDLEKFRNSWKMWGNPSADNVTSLFNRLGVADVFEGLSWQRQSTQSLKTNLNTINQVRNRIAHAQEIRVDNRPYALRLSGITRWRNTIEQFGKRFSKHALAKF